MTEQKLSNDKEWTFSATCKSCGRIGKFETNTYKNPIWACGECKMIHNIVRRPDLVAYEKADKEKKKILKEMYEEHLKEKQ